MNHEPAPAVDALLNAATATIASARYCWLLTMRGNRGRVRPMGQLPHVPGQDPWVLSFLTRGTSRKVADIRRNERLCLTFQNDGADAYVALSGAATILDDPATVQLRWKTRYNVHFPTEAERACALFLSVAIDSMELWIRGVTPEPFGSATTTLCRDAAQHWRIDEG